MLFNSVSYLVFFPIVFALYWIAKPGKVRQVVLLFASYFFYMSWLPKYGLLLFGLTTVNYFLGLGIDKFKEQKNLSKAIFALGLLVNLGSLCYYKYANFVLQSIEDALKYFNLINSKR